MMKKIILNFLMSHGRDISDFLGSSLKNKEEYPSYYWALDKKDSLTFLELCLNSAVPVIGEDAVYRLPDGGYDFDIMHWSYSRDGNESFTEYLNNSIRKAKEYLGYFPTDENTLFSFTLHDQFIDDLYTLHSAYK